MPVNCELYDQYANLTLDSANDKLRFELMLDELKFTGGAASLDQVVNEYDLNPDKDPELQDRMSGLYARAVKVYGGGFDEIELPAKVDQNKIVNYLSGVMITKRLEADEARSENPDIAPPTVATLKKFLLDLIDSKIETENEYTEKWQNIKKYFDDHEDISGYFHKVLSNLYTHYKVDPEEQLNFDEENIYEKTFEETVFESSRKDNVNSELKEILSALVTDQRDDYIGERKFVDFDPVFNKLLIEMADTVSADEMEEKLRRLAFFFPVYQQILDRIKLPEDVTDRTYERQDRIRNAYFTSFRNSYFNSIISQLRRQEEDNRIVSRTFYSNDNTPENNLVAQWRENLTRENLDDEARSILKDTRTELQNHIAKGAPIESVINELAGLMQSVGIDVRADGKSILRESILKDVRYSSQGTNELKWLESNYVRDFFNILGNVIEGKPVFAASEEEFAQAQSGHVKNIATRLKVFDDYIYESVSRNVRGDNIWNINQPSYLTDVVNAFKVDSPQKIARVQQLLSQYQQTYAYPYSNWLKDFMNEDGTLNLENCRKLEYRLIGGMDIQDSDGLRYKDYTVKDGLIFNVIQYAFNGEKEDVGRYILPVQADAGNNYALQYKRIPVTYDPRIDSNYITINFSFTNNKGEKVNVNMGKISKTSPIYQAFRNNLRLELARMRDARNLLFDDSGALRREYLPQDQLSPAERDSNDLLYVEFRERRRNLTSKLIQYYHFQKTDENGIPIVVDDKGKVTGNVFKFQYFTHLNNVARLFNENGTITSDPAIITNETSHLNKDAVWHKINNEILPLTFEQFYKKGVNDFIGNQKIPKHFQVTINGQNRAIDQVIIDMALNYALFVPEYDVMFAGGSIFAKNPDDGIKREKQVSTHGLPNNIGGTFTGAYVKDLRIRAGTYDQILDNFRHDIAKRKPFLNKEEQEAEAVAMAKPYEAINSTDSATYITKERLADILRGMGRNGKTLEVRQAIQNILDDNYDSKDINIAFNPLKPFYSYMHFDTELKVPYFVQVKNSEIPLLPNIIKGTDLEVIDEAMHKQKVDALIFESAAKVGARGISTTNDLDNLNRITFFNDGYRIQLENPESHLDYNAVMGLQPKKLMMAGLSGDAIYEGMMGVDGKLSGPQLLDRHNRIESSLIKSSSDKLLSRIGAKYIGGQLQLTDLTKLQDILQDEVLRSQLNDNFLDSVALEQIGDAIDFSVPLWSSIAGRKLKSVILSLFSHNITNQKITGFGMVQTPGELFSIKRGTPSVNLASIPPHVRNRIQLINRKREEYKNGTFELKSSVIRDGSVTRMEVLLPATSKKYYTKNGIVDINELPEELRTFFAYRIPNQGKYSSSIIEVVGFLPPEAGSQVVIPNEVLVRMGSDFDIDKLYGMGYAFTKRGKNFAVHQFSTKPEDAMQRWKDRANDILADERNVSQQTQELFDYRDEQEELSKSDKVKEADDAIIDNLVSDGLLPSFEEFVKLPVEDQNSDSAKKNAMLSDFISVMANPHHFAEQSTPTSFDRIKQLARKYGKNERRPYSKQLIIDNETRRFEARQDKQLVGVSASNNAYTLSVMSSLKAELANGLSVPVRYTKADVEKYDLKKRFADSVLNELADGSIILSMDKIGWANDNPSTSVYGDLMSENYNMIIGAATDGIKDPSLGYIGFNMLTVNALGSAILLGHDWEWVAALGNQPVIKLYHEIFDDESSGYDGLLRQQLRTKVSPKTLAKRRIEGILQERVNDPVILKDKIGKKLPNIDEESMAVSAEQLNHNIKNVDWNFQFKVWRLFQRMENAGQAITSNLLALRSDSIGAGPSTAQTNDFIRSIDGARLESNVLVDGLSLMTAIYPRFYNLEENSSYSALQDYFEQSNLRSLDLIGKLFVEETPAFRYIRGMLLSMLPQNAPGIDYARYENRLNDYAVAYMSSEFPMFSMGYEDLFKGSNTLADRIAKMRDKIKERTDAGEANVNGHLLLPVIELEDSAADLKRNRNMKLFGLRNTSQGYTKEAENLLIEDWYNMLTDESKEMRELAMDLVKGNYHLYGMLPGLRALTHLVPVRWLKEIGYVDYLRQQGSLLLDPTVLTPLIESYIQHNYRDGNLVPNTNWNYYDPEIGKRIYGRQTWDRESRTLKVNPNFQGSDPDLKTAKYVTANIVNPDKSVVPVLFRHLGTDIDGNRWFRPLDKKGLGTRMYEFGNQSISYQNVGKMKEDFAKSDDEYKALISQKFNISLRDDNDMNIDLTNPETPVTPTGEGTTTGGPVKPEYNTIEDLFGPEQESNSNIPPCAT